MLVEANAVGDGRGGHEEQVGADVAQGVEGDRAHVGAAPRVVLAAERDDGEPGVVEELVQRGLKVGDDGQGLPLGKLGSQVEAGGGIVEDDRLPGFDHGERRGGHCPLVGDVSDGTGTRCWIRRECWASRWPGRGSCGSNPGRRGCRGSRCTVIRLTPNASGRSSMRTEPAAMTISMIAVAPFARPHGWLVCASRRSGPTPAGSLMAASSLPARSARPEGVAHGAPCRT